MRTDPREHLGPVGFCSPELAAFLRLLRATASSRVPTAKRGGRYSQEDVARGAGLPTDLYQRIERERAAVTSRTVAGLDTFYLLTQEQRERLYLLALGWVPDAMPEIRPDDVARSALLVDATSRPAALIGPAYEILHANGQFWSWLPGAGCRNLFDLVLFSPAIERLVDWERSWALPLLVDLHFAQWSAPTPLRGELDALIEQIRARGGRVAQLWDQALATLRVPEVQARSVLCEHGREYQVELAEFEPDQLPWHRILTFQFTTDPGCCPGAAVRGA